MAVESDAKSDPDALSPEVVQVALAALVIAIERLLEPADADTLLEACATELRDTPDLSIHPQFREQLLRIQEEFQGARHFVRVQLRDPPTDLMT